MRAISLGLVTSVSLLWPGGAAVRLVAQELPPAVEQHFRAAQRAQEAGDLNRAREEYQAVLRQLPSSAEAYRNLGLLDYLQNKFDDCAHKMEQALKLKPDVAGADLYLGISLAKLSRPKLGVPHLAKALQREPANKEASAWLAKALFDSGRTTESIASLERSLAKFPDDVDMPFLLGEAYRKAASNELDEISRAAPKSPFLELEVAEAHSARGEWPEAMAAYERALQRDPRLPGAHFAMGLILLGERKLAPAVKEFQQELAIRPSALWPQQGLAEVELTRSTGAVDLRKGLGLLQSAIRANRERARTMTFYAELPFHELNPESRAQYRAALAALLEQQNADPVSLQLALALVHARLGNRPEEEAARGRFERALENPGDHPTPAPAGSLTRAGMEFEAQEYQSAARNLRQVLTAKPTELGARYLLAKSYQALAVVTLRDLLVKAPDSYRAHQLLAQVYLSKGENGKALDEYREVVRAEPTLPGAHFALGDLLWRTGRAEDQALACLTGELGVNPQHAEANAEIGTIYVSKGEAEKAIPYLQRALELKPDLLAARRDLGRAYFQQHEVRKAEAMLKQALPVDEDGAVRYMLWKVYTELGRAEDASLMLEQFRQIKGDERKVRQSRAQ